MSSIDDIAIEVVSRTVGGGATRGEQRALCKAILRAAGSALVEIDGPDLAARFTACETTRLAKRAVQFGPGMRRRT